MYKEIWPGEYLHDMHDGREALAHKLKEIGTRNYHIAQFGIYSEQQRQALTLFMDATRRLHAPSDTYLNKMLMAVDDTVAVYMYDDDRFGFVML